MSNAASRRAAECQNEWPNGTCPQCGESHYVIVRKGFMEQAIARAVEAAVKADQEAWGRDHPGCLPVARKNAALTARLADAELVLDRIANDYGTDNALDDAMYYQQLAAGALKENT